MADGGNVVTISSGGRGRGTRGGTPPGQHPNDWRTRLVRNTRGRPEANAFNLLLILEHDPELADLFYLDEFGNRVGLDRQPPWTGGRREEFTEIDALELAAWLGASERYEIAVKSDQVLQAVEAMARRRRRHSVREYLDGLSWDQQDRVSAFFSTYLGADNNSYTRGASACFLVSAVSRIMWEDAQQPTKGSKVDFMVVLEGAQGAGKTTAVLELFSSDWYAEATESPSHKDFYQTLRGRWGIEIGEMDAFSKADVAKVKQAITTRTDVYRPSYGRIARGFRRECVMVGTTNRDDWQRDETGARRFLPVIAKRADIAAIRKDRDQIWAQAVAMFRGGFKWWELPEGAQREQDARYSEDVWTARIERWVTGNDPRDGAYAGIDFTNPVEWTPSRGGNPGRPCEFTVADVLLKACSVEVSRQDRAQATRVGAVLTRLGFKCYRPRRLGERVRVYYLPSDAEQGGAT